MIGAFLLAMQALAAQAVLPTPSASDPHSQSVYYRANRTVALIGHLGFQTMIRFEEGEKIENVAIGDATSWQVTPNKRADMLFVKPTGRSAPTNMVVVTNRRTYSFALSVAPPKASSARAAWTLSFVLPPAPAPRPVAAPPATVSAEGKNRAYTLVGPEALLPTQAFDDGAATYFSWPDNVAMPAIFAVTSDGSEAIVNFIMRDGFVMVQQTAWRFVLRQGGASATVTYTPGVEKRLPTPAGKR